MFPIQTDDFETAWPSAINNRGKGQSTAATS